MTVLNAMVAEFLKTDALIEKKGMKKDDAIFNVLRDRQVIRSLSGDKLKQRQALPAYIHEKCVIIRTPEYLYRKRINSPLPS